MLFSEVDTIVSDLTDSTSTSYPTATRLIYANNAQKKVAGVIIGADGRWSWDDTNQTDLPIGTTDLVSGQEDYSFDTEFLKVKKVQILDSSGNTQKLHSKDMKDYRGEIYQNNQASVGTPLYYDKDGVSIFLDPIPNYNSTGGLKVYFQRVTKDITSFGATSPGFYEVEHEILAYMIAIPYCIKHKPDRVVAYQNEVFRGMESLKEFYSRRSKDEKFGTMTPNKLVNNR